MMRRILRSIMRSWPGAVLLWAVVVSSIGSPLSAQAHAPSNLAGQWTGTLDAGGTSLPLVLHLRTTPDGELSGVLNSPAQTAQDLPLDHVIVNGSEVRFDVPVVHGSYRGTLAADGKTLQGTWTQGASLPLTFHQEMSAAEAAAVKPSPVDGDWAGTLHAGSQDLRTIVHVHGLPGGALAASFDSLDQGDMGLPCADVTLQGRTFRFAIPVVHGSYEGELSADGQSIRGTWTQGKPLPLTLVRARPAAAEPAPAPAAAPVKPANLGPVLDRAFAPVLKNGVLSPATGGGVVIGVLEGADKRIFAYGAARPDSIFEIGSVTKTFTGLALAQMVEQKKVTLNEPVRELLPNGAVAKPPGREITLLDLATQHSGLPRLPDNLRPADPSNPYADYDASHLLEYLNTRGVGRAEKTNFEYSNLGVGLLGYALAQRMGVSYDDLIRNEVTGPMNLHDTTIELSPAQKQRFIPGHDGAGRVTGAWDINALAGAGGLRSTADDLLHYCQALMAPEKLGTEARAGSPAATLPASLLLDREVRADGPGPLKIALLWLVNPQTGEYWHNGGTGGYTASVSWNPRTGRAVVVLYNREDADPGKPQFVERVRAHVSALLAGAPAPALDW
jgi:D-alanyl-D-alanine-carboxypeptidase/D-alanyl-D-alanine-endopeptidase